MSDMTERQGVWFVYDGECPLCTRAALALRIKQQYGSLHLVNAREKEADDLLAEIKACNIDLDDGMVIYHRGQFYHGKDALKFMADHGDAQGLMNRVNCIVFRTDRMNRIFYPLLRSIRNALLYLRGIKKIDNLRTDAS